MLFGWELLSDEERDRIARGVRDGAVHGGPYHLLLFPTNRCNLDCFFCNSLELRERGDELDWDLPRRTLEDGLADGLKGISFTGGGEPMLYSRLGELFAWCREHAIRYRSLTTNGTPLTPETCRALQGCRADQRRDPQGSPQSPAPSAAMKNIYIKVPFYTNKGE